MRVVGVDPGSVHCGVSIWQGEPPVCTTAFELSPERYVEWLNFGQQREVDTIYIERYTPKGGYGSAQTGTETQWIIGYTKWWCHLNRVEFVVVERKDRKAARTRARAGGYRFLAHGHGDHAADGESVAIAGLRIPIAQLLAGQSPNPGVPG